MKKKVLVAKLGKSILFNENYWGAAGGANEAPILFETLFRNNPQNEYYLLGKSDFLRLKSERVNQHGNVFDLWEDFDSKKADERRMADTEYILEKTTNMEFDYAIIFGGPTGIYNHPWKIRKQKDSSEIVKLSVMSKLYTAPVLAFLNERKIPYYLIINDPRNVINGKLRDLFHKPFKVLSQIDDQYTMRTWNSYQDKTINKEIINLNYSRIETIFLNGEEYKRREIPQKENNKFCIVLNEGDPSRYDKLEEFVLDDFENVEIYGKWKDSRTKEDSRFKGPKRFNELKPILDQTKYTFCIPIKEGWVTAKFWEKIQHGVIPFLHPDYDTQKHLECPDFLRVNSSKEMKEKIERLENNKEFYNSIWKELIYMLKDEYYDGSFVSKLMDGS